MDLGEVGGKYDQNTVYKIFKELTQTSFKREVGVKVT